MRMPTRLSRTRLTALALSSFGLLGEDVRDEQTALARVNRAEMAHAFIRSAEYRGRFGP